MAALDFRQAHQPKMKSSACNCSMATFLRTMPFVGVSSSKVVSLLWLVSTRSNIWSMNRAGASSRLTKKEKHATKYSGRLRRRLKWDAVF